MKPDDLTLDSFEEKAKKAQELAGFGELSSHEISAIKDKIRFVLFDTNPAQLSVAQIADWIRRSIPGIRNASARLSAHTMIAGGACDPDTLVPVQAAPFELRVASGEVICGLMNGRKVRFNPTSLVVTPIRVDNESQDE